MTAHASNGSETSVPPSMRASGLLRVRIVWMTVAAIASVLIASMTLNYVGSVVDPVGDLHGLLVLVVNEDAGSTFGTRHLDIGKQVVSALDRSPAVSTPLASDSVTLSEALQCMDANGTYATIVIPPNLTFSTVALFGMRAAGGPAPSLRTIELPTSPAPAASA